MTHIFHYLARDPEEIRKLRDEQERLKYISKGYLSPEALKADHLNGVINEALRLHHPVQSGLHRFTPAEGLTINGVFIPGDTTVICPTYAIGRSEKCFVRANEFIPERWYSSPELILNEKGFAPFTLGAYSCIGKHLALMSIRAVVSKVVANFDVSFAPGEDGYALLNDTKDIFTMAMGDLKLRFKNRCLS